MLYFDKNVALQAYARFALMEVWPAGPAPMRDYAMTYARAPRAPLARTRAYVGDREYVYVRALSRLQSTHTRTRSRVLVLYTRDPEIDSRITRTRLSSYL